MNEECKNCDLPSWTDCRIDENCYKHEGLTKHMCMSCGDREWLKFGRKTTCHGCDHGSLQICIDDEMLGMMV